MLDEKVSIVVPVYNVEKYLRRCIESILNQNYLNFELIMVDDGSTDLSPQICDEYEKKDSRILVIHKANEGAGEARNKGIELATGKYITFVDSDDYIAPFYLERMLTIAKTNECEIVQCGFLFGSETAYPFEKEVGIQKEPMLLNNHEVFETRKAKIIMCAKLYQTALFSDIKYPRISVHDDEFITYKLFYKAKRIALISTPMYYYFNSENSIMRTRKEYYPENFVNAYEERIAFFQEKGEEKLANISYKEKCIRLMLFYIQCCENPKNKNNKKALVQMYRKDYKIAVRVKSTYREKISMCMFRFFPSTFAWIMNRLK